MIKVLTESLFTRVGNCDAANGLAIEPVLATAQSLTQNTWRTEQFRV